MKQYNLKINGNPYEVTVESVGADGTAKVTVNGKEHIVEIEGYSRPAAPSPAAISPAAQASPAPTVQAQQPAAAGNGKDVVAPLPGVIIAVNVNVGDKVSAGQSVATLEAMKMENAIEAESAGTVTAIHVQKGDSVLEGAKIVTIA